MSTHCSKMPHCRNSQNGLKTNAKSFQRELAKQTAKVALKPNLSELEAEFRQARIDFDNLTGSQARLLAKLHPLIDFYRTRWIELANIRNRIQRSTR